MVIAHIVETHCFTLRLERAAPVVQHSISARAWSAVHLDPSSRRVFFSVPKASQLPRLGPLVSLAM
jgi:hypothetical protein